MTIERFCVRCGLGLLTAVAGCQSSAPVLRPAPLPDPAAVETARARLSRDLRIFLTAQEAYFADHVRYAGSVGELEGFFRPSPGVVVVLLTSAQASHSEIAIDLTVPGLVCGIYVGDVSHPLGRGREGEVVCRGP